MAARGNSINLKPRGAGDAGTRVRGWLVIGLLAGGLLSRGEAPAPSSPPIRIGFSDGMFTDVNENDAKAAMKVWGQTILRQRGISMEPEPAIFNDRAALRDALVNRQVDLVGLTLPAYNALHREVRLAPVFLTYNTGRMTEQYVLLARQDGPIAGLEDLQGRHLAFFKNLRTSLAQPWLDTVLVQQGLRPAAAWAGKITEPAKLSKVVLPVFFRQLDACVVTRSGFDTMTELNPQVGKQLKIIAVSPAVVPVVFAFRADYASPVRAELFAAIRELHTTPVGQQILTIFHSEKVEEQSASSLDSALELLAEHARLTRRETAASATVSGAPDDPPPGRTP